MIIATNQSGVGRGYFTEKKLKSINRAILKKLSSKQVEISAVYYCPHLPEAGCACRKPKTKMIKDAQKKFNLNLKKSFCIGDKLTDVEFGKNAGIKSILVMTGYGKKEARKIKEKGISPDYLAKNMVDAAIWILRNQKA